MNHIKALNIKIAIMEGKSKFKMLILPRNRSRNAQIVTLAHPRTNTPSRYLFDPSGDVYEFIRVAAPKPAYQSWLVTSSQDEKQAQHWGESECEEFKHQDSAEKAAPNEVTKEQSRGLAEDYISSKPDILVATPIDPLFMLIPALCDDSSTKSTSKQLFLTSEDLLDKISEKSKDFEQIINCQTLRTAFDKRFQAICDSVDAGDEKVYRINESKLLAELVVKATKVVDSGLPASMEDRFVRRALDIPVIGITREESDPLESQPNLNETPDSDAPTVDSQMSTATSISATSAESCATELTTPNDSTSPMQVGLERLLRLRTVLTYMLMSYVPKAVATNLNALLASQGSPIDFQPLNEQLEHIAKVRAEALTARSLGNFTRKRNAYEDDAAEARAEKKRRKEEEDKKKKLETRGIRELKKADVTGMKKMSDFFGKGVAAKKN